MAIHIQRRELIVTLGGAAAWPLAVRRQQQTMPVIGYLGSGSAETSAIWRGWILPGPWGAWLR